MGKIQTITLVLSGCVVSYIAQATAISPAIVKSKVKPVIVDARDGPMPTTREAVVNAAERRQKKVVVHLQNISLVDDSEIVELVVMETRELLDGSGFTNDRGVIIQCPLVCGQAQPTPKPPEGSGKSMKVTVSALDGPMPATRMAIKNARRKNFSLVVVEIENAVAVDPEILELVVLETTELLASFDFTARNSSIIQCAGKC